MKHYRDGQAIEQRLEARRRQRAWREYEAANAKANERYQQDRASIDRRYNPAWRDRDIPLPDPT